MPEDRIEPLFKPRRRCLVGFLWYWSNGVLIHIDIWSADDAE
jgi:hypothetical protein